LWPVPPLPQNLLALIPLALILGDITEDLAMRFGDVIGG
jgi:Ca2+:H+ antiporter